LIVAPKETAKWTSGNVFVFCIVSGSVQSCLVFGVWKW